MHKGNGKLWARLNTVGLFMGFILFLMMISYGIRDLLAHGVTLHVQYLVVLAVLIPVSMHLAVLRFRLICRSIACDISYQVSSGVVIWGGITNILPLPSSFLIRVGFLASKVGVRTSALLNMMSAFIWIASACLAAIILSVTQLDPLILGSLCILFLTSVSIAVFFREKSSASVRISCQIAVLQLAQTAINISRTVLVAYGIGIDLPAAVAGMMALTGAAATATGVFPSGFGLSELLAALVAGSFGIAPGVGAILAVVNRLTDWIGFALFIPISTKPTSKSEASV